MLDAIVGHMVVNVEVNQGCFTFWLDDGSRFLVYGSPLSYEYRHKPRVVTENVMIKLVDTNVSFFRCECGGNVFSKFEDERYQCHSCGAWYRGE